MCQEGRSLEQVKYACARTQSWKAPTCRNFCLRIQFCTDSRKILCGVSSQGDGRCQTCQVVSNWIPQRLETVFQPWLPPVSSNTLDAPSLAQDNVHSSGLPWGPKMTHLFSFILLVLYSISKDTKPSLLGRLPTLQSFYFLVYGGRSGFFGWLWFFDYFHPCLTFSRWPAQVCHPTNRDLDTLGVPQASWQSLKCRHPPVKGGWSWVFETSGC